MVAMVVLRTPKLVQVHVASDLPVMAILADEMSRVVSGRVGQPAPAVRRRGRQLGRCRGRPRRIACLGDHHADGGIWLQDAGWLAIRDGNLRDALGVLGGRIVGAGDWQQGVDRAYDEADIVVATPLLPGADGAAWLLLAGRWVLANRDLIDPAALSAALGREVQLFVTHRASRGTGGNAQSAGGRFGRSSTSASGDVIRWHGDPQDAELTIGLPPTFDIARDSVSDYWGVAVREEDVMRVAAAWSVDPTSLEGRPANEPLTIAQLPLGHDPPTNPVGQSMVVDITDLISSGTSYEDFQEKVASRRRECRETIADDE
jgi:hypothetical protein